MTQNVLFDIRGHCGFISLNRPQALNALSFDMVTAIDAQLAVWEHDDAVNIVVITGENGRAFCAGGDVKSVAQDVKNGDGALTTAFFRAEYTMNHRLHLYPKPVVALVDGMVMGGGVGLSAHGSHRVVTENTVFAMPETGIGFFPDVGCGYFLPRCPGQTGLYLAMTGQRLGPVDSVYAGYATDFVPAAKLPPLAEALATMGWSNREDAKAQVSRAIEVFATPAPGESALAPLRADIDRIFSYERVNDIAGALEDESTKFAGETLASLYAACPFSLHVALRHLRGSAGKTFADIMRMEYRLSQHMTRRPDFYEGIRALLIDKDKKPKWHPARIAGVSDAEVSVCFHAHPTGELGL